jgi:hypothetical protein
MALGNRKESIVFDDADRQRFLRTLGEASERAGLRVSAYALTGKRKQTQKCWFFANSSGQDSG